AVMDKLPAVQSEFMFSYLVYCFGWLGGLTLCFVVLSFLMRFAYVLRRIGDPYGALIVLGLLIAFMIQFVWSILMTMSLLPFVGYSLPFISSGGAMMTLQLALIGVVISIYRRKHYYMY